MISKMNHNVDNCLCSPWIPPAEFKDDDPPLDREKWFRIHQRRDALSGLRWVRSSGGEVPADAFRCGQGCFVGRCFYEGSMIPGRVDPEKGACLITWGGEEHLRSVYEVLCTDGKFVPITPDTTEGLLKATTAGLSALGDPLFIGRVRGDDGDWICGKVVRSRGVCCIAYNGKEKTFSEYEVFVGMVHRKKTCCNVM